MVWIDDRAWVCAWGSRLEFGLERTGFVRVLDRARMGWGLFVGLVVTVVKVSEWCGGVVGGGGCG